MKEYQVENYPDLRDTNFSAAEESTDKFIETAPNVKNLCQGLRSWEAGNSYSWLASF
nr:hypothetical protein [Flavobacterium sp.]